MIKINIPNELTDPLALRLLNETLPEEITYREINSFDLMGKRVIIDNKNYREGFVFKTIAALGYESRRDGRNTAFCYNRASACALRCNLPLAAYVCIGKVFSIYPHLLLEDNEEANNAIKEILIYVPNKIRFAAELYKRLYSENKPRRVTEFEHNWFTEVKEGMPA